MRREKIQEYGIRQPCSEKSQGEARFSHCPIPNCRS